MNIRACKLNFWIFFKRKSNLVIRILIEREVQLLNQNFYEKISGDWSKVNKT